MYGYFVNSGKTWLVVKEDRFDEAQNVFQGTGVNITKEWKCHLGAALGCEAFVSQYVQQQAHKWASQVDHLANIVKTQPQCAYAAYRHSFVSRWTFLARTVEGIGDLLQPLEDAIRQRFLPALTGRESPGELERELFALPTRLGGLGITDPTTSVGDHFQASKQVTAPLVALIVQQKEDLRMVCNDVSGRRNDIKLKRWKEQTQAAAA